MCLITIGVLIGLALLFAPKPRHQEQVINRPRPDGVQTVQEPEAQQPPVMTVVAAEPAEQVAEPVQPEVQVFATNNTFTVEVPGFTFKGVKSGK